jgi:hypothetical protein
MTKKIASVALLLALLFEASIFGQTPGIGYLLFWLASAGGTFYLLGSSERLRFDRVWLFIPSLLLAFALFRYDGVVLKTWGALCCLLFLGWAVAWNLVVDRHLEALSRVFPQGTFNPLKLGGQAKESLKVEMRCEQETVLQVCRGMLLGSVLLLVFGTLLVQADAVFGAKLEEVGDLFAGISPGPVLRTGFWLFWLAGALKVWVSQSKSVISEERTFFGSTELLIALGSLNLLLASFLTVQARYLFGDSALVESLGLNHAQYARRGFFELTICIALILPLVLLAYRAARVHQDSRLTGLGGGLILSAFGLAVSALQRMNLYIDVYGLSVERFYAAAGIVVAMVVLAWAGLCCLRPKPISWLLARQYVTVAFLLGVLGLVNVEALVARSQLSLAQAGVRAIDETYLSGLGCDAVEVVREYKSRLTAAEQTSLDLIEDNITAEADDFSGVSFNIARREALVARKAPPGNP